MEKNPTLLFVVAAAMFNENGEILVQKRPDGKPMAGLWEFPGGKVEVGEGPENALVRELEEELAIVISEEDLVPMVFASEALDRKHLVLLLYGCSNWQGDIQSQEQAEICWLPLEQLSGLDMPPADGPLVEKLLKLI